MKLLVKFFVTMLIACLVSINALATDKKAFSMEPNLNNGKKWRIAYYEGGPYIDYQQIFSETIRGLMHLGWIETSELPKQKGEETKTLWEWLATKAKSKYLEFPKDAYYSAEWTNKQRKEKVNSLVQRLNHTKDIDLLIAMGTQAGQDFANNQHHTPTLVLSSSDPIAAGIIKSAEDSGFNHIHATVDPTRYERQIRVFHEIINFKKLGIFFEDSVNGRSFSAIDIVKKIANERNFDVIVCYTFDEIIDDNKAKDDSVKKCFQELIDKKVDAIYVTQQYGVNNGTIPKLVEMSLENHIPTFSQAGSSEVKYGFLLSLSQAGFKYIGDFHAQTIAQVLNGAKPGELGQLFKEPPKIAINLRTAEIIGFNPPLVMLGAADEMFEQIQKPSE